MLYVDKRVYEDSQKGRIIKRTEFVVGYSRVPTPFHSFHKAIFGAIVALLVFVAFIALRATDVPDTKPTIDMTGGW